MNKRINVIVVLVAVGVLCTVTYIRASEPPPPPGCAEQLQFHATHTNISTLAHVATELRAGICPGAARRSCKCVPRLNSRHLHIS